MFYAVAYPIAEPPGINLFLFNIKIALTLPCTELGRESVRTEASVRRISQKWTGFIRKSRGVSKIYKTSLSIFVYFL